VIEEVQLRYKNHRIASVTKRRSERDIDRSFGSLGCVQNPGEAIFMKAQFFLENLQSQSSKQQYQQSSGFHQKKRRPTRDGFLESHLVSTLIPPRD